MRVSSLICVVVEKFFVGVRKVENQVALSVL